MKKIVNIFNSCAQGIVIAVIVGTIIEMLIPNGKNKKYIKTVIGMYLLFVIIYPVINKFTGKSIELNNLDLSKYSKTYETSLDTEKYINKSYENNLKQEITLMLKEKGYISDNIKLKTSSNYETITEISLSLEKIETDNNSVNEIKTVEINTSKEKNKRNRKNENNENNSKNDENYLSNAEIEEVKSFLSQELGVDKSKIYIEY